MMVNVSSLRSPRLALEKLDFDSYGDSCALPFTEQFYVFLNISVGL